MRRFSVLAVALAVMLSLGVGVATATHPGTTVLVDASDGNSDVGGCGAVANPCNTITAAVAHATAGDTIDIAAGTYAETFVVDKQLTIQGAGSATTIVDAVGGPAHGILLTAGGTSASDRLTISGLTVENSPLDGIRAYKAGGLSLDHVTLDDVVLTDNVGKGMEIHNDVVVTDMEIVDSAFTDNGSQGLRTASNVVVNGLTITDSTFNENSYGIYLQGTIDGLTIVRSEFNDSVGGYGAYMTETGPLTNLVVEDSEFLNNVVGMMVWNVQDNADLTITGTTFKDNDRWGLLIWGDTLTNVLVSESLVTDNDGSGLGYYGIDFNTYDAAMTNVEVHFSSITGHAVGGGIKNRNTVPTAVVDGTCNWWGATDGPSGPAGSGLGDGVTAYVEFLPWLMTSDLAGACNGGTPNGAKAASVANLQALLPTGDAKADHKIEKAIDRLEKSLTPEWWVDYMTLDPKDGKKVFDEEKKAVKELTKKETEGIPGAQDVVDALVEADEMLAQKAIDDAVAAFGDAKFIDKANKEMAKAAEELTKGKPDKAIEHYKKAWQNAQKAV